MASIKVLNPPTLQLISLDDVKKYLVVEDNYNDAYITRLINAVAREIERVGSIALGTQQIEYEESVYRPQYNRMIAYPLRPPFINLPRAPLQTVDHVQVLDAFDTWQDIDLADVAYHDDLPPKLFVKSVYAYNIGYGEIYASALAIKAIKLTYTAGYSDLDSTPPEYVQAMYELLAFRYQNREGGPPPAGIYASFQRGHMRL